MQPRGARRLSVRARRWAVSAESDEEFREFMRGRWPAMVRLAYGLTGDLGHAEDVAQSAFARAYASWPKLTRSGNPEAYIRQEPSTASAGGSSRTSRASTEPAPVSRTSSSLAPPSERPEERTR